MQKHAARRFHYDLRLEMDGVLKSWAVPKGPSMRHGEKRLAVHVEDHPVEYGDFEGVIPRDNYGAGSVIVWDQGWYRLAKGDDPLRELERGKIEFELYGQKLRGRWTLARMGGRRSAEGGKDWLLLKAPDAYADREEPVERAPESIFSGLTVEEIGRESEKRAALDALLAALDAPAGEVSGRRQGLMLATLVDAPPAGADWLHEIKYDGVRVLAERVDDTVTLYGRSGDAITTRYPEIARALRALPVSRFVIDGEIVALGRGWAAELPAAAGPHAPHARRGHRRRARGGARHRVLLRLPRRGGARSPPPAARRSQALPRAPGAAARGDPLLRARRRGAGPRSSRRWAISVSRASWPSGRRAATRRGARATGSR